jgi:single-strand DNA-binding protein
MNIVFFTGNVGGDAEVRTVGQSDVCNFSVAVKQGFGRDAKTEWYRVAVWGQRSSSIAQHIKKGGKVAVVGELEIGSYNGKPQYNVRAHEVDPFCGGKREDTGGAGSPGGGGGSAYDPDLDDNVPFLSCDPRRENRRKVAL